MKLIVAVVFVAIVAVAAFLLVRGESEPPPGPSESAAAPASREDEPGGASSALEAASQVERSEAQASRRALEFGGIAGLLVDEKGAPVTGATVTLTIREASRARPGLADLARSALEPAPATSDARGAFAFENLPAGASFSLEVSAAGLCGAHRFVTVLPRRTQDLGRIELEAGVIASGIVVDEAGAGLAGAVVGFMQRDSSGKVECDSEGRFVLPPLRSPISLSAWKPGFVLPPPRTREFLAEPGATHMDVRVMLVGESVISGTARDTLGNPVEGAIVSALFFLDNGHRGVAQAQTDANGAFRIPGIPWNVTVERLSVRSPHHRWPDLEKYVVGPGASAVEIVLQPLPVIRLSIRDAASGAPVAPESAQLRFWTTDPGGASPSEDLLKKAKKCTEFRRGARPEDLDLVTDAPGEIAMPCEHCNLVWEQRVWYVALVEAEGYLEALSPIVAVGERETYGPITICLTPAGHVSGMVLDPWGVPVDGAEVLLLAVAPQTQHGAAPVNKRVVSGPGGAFSFFVQRTADYRVLARDPAFGELLTESFPAGPGACASDLMLRMRQGGFIVGRIVEVDGKPAAGIKVVAYDAQGGQGIGGDSDAGGEYRLGPLPAGAYRVSDSASELAARLLGSSATGQSLPSVGPDRSVFPVIVEDGSETRFDLIRPAGGEIQGTAFADGRPARGCLIRALLTAGAAGRERRADIVPDQALDEQGAFRLVHLPAGRYEVTLRTMTRSPRSSLVTMDTRSVEVREGEVTTVRFDFELRNLIVTVVDEDSGVPLQVQLTLRSRSPNAMPCTDRTGSDGCYVLEALPPGIYDLSFYSQEEPPEPKRVLRTLDLRAASIENEKVRIPSCGSLTFDLPDDLVEGASIESVLLRAGGQERPLAPARAGRRGYLVDRVPHGRHEVVLRVSVRGESREIPVLFPLRPLERYNPGGLIRRALEAAGLIEE